VSHPFFQSCLPTPVNISFATAVFDTYSKHFNGLLSLSSFHLNLGSLVLMGNPVLDFYFISIFNGEE
jgi:hypothetical protein